MREPFSHIDIVVPVLVAVLLPRQLALDARHDAIEAVSWLDAGIDGLRDGGRLIGGRPGLRG